MLMRTEFIKLHVPLFYVEYWPVLYFNCTPGYNHEVAPSTSLSCPYWYSLSC